MHTWRALFTSSFRQTLAKCSRSIMICCQSYFLLMSFRHAFENLDILSYKSTSEPLLFLQVGCQRRRPLQTLILHPKWALLPPRLPPQPPFLLRDMIVPIAVSAPYPQPPPISRTTKPPRRRSESCLSFLSHLIRGDGRLYDSVCLSGL